jgi:hypothetical protein
MAKVEDIVFVNDVGIINRFSNSRELHPGDNIAVELVMVYLPSKKQIVLFNRGAGASDMHAHWALEAGKVNVMDLSKEDGDRVGSKMSLNAYKSSAVREFAEELNFPVSATSLEFVDEFHMPDKRLYFTLLSLAIKESQLGKLLPDQSEVGAVGCFNLEQFSVNPDLGDAIVFRKDRIIEYLQEKFGGNGLESTFVNE